LDAALNEFEIGIRLLNAAEDREDSRIAEGERNWSLALARKGKLKEALEHCQRAVTLDEQSASARQTLGQLLADAGDIEGAQAAFTEALRRRPNDPALHASLGVIAGRRKDLPLTRKHFAEAIRLAPGDPVLRFRRAVVLEELFQRPDEAKSDYEAVLSLVEKSGGSPLAHDAHLHLGSMARSKGDTESAIAHYRSALQQDRESSQAANNLAWILATSPDERFREGVEAVKLAELACRATNHQRPDCLDTLAAAYAEVGEWEKAVATARLAADRAKELQDSTLTREIEQRRELYENLRPYRAKSPPSKP
ncbi:MAG: tetratricopeptide repeat protein, partial [Planctomycetota bacterium]